MKKLNCSLIFGGITGFFAVAFAAYATHVLKAILTAHDFENVTEALHYQQLHATVMIVIGLAQMAVPAPLFPLRRLKLASLLFGCGIILFCGGLYIAALSTHSEALHLVPIGGFAFMAGWLVLASAGFKKTA